MLVVAIMALRQPKGTSAIAGTISTAAPSTSSSAPRPASSSKASASPTRTAPSRPTRTASRPAGTSTSSSSLRAVPLVVLNNTATPNLARDAAARFTSGGWTVTSFGGLQNEIVSTCAYYDPNAPRAKAAAEALHAQYPVIKRVAPKFAELPTGPVVVVLTPDYSPN